MNDNGIAKRTLVFLLCFGLNTNNQDHNKTRVYQNLQYELSHSTAKQSLFSRLYNEDNYLSCDLCDYKTLGCGSGLLSDILYLCDEHKKLCHIVIK